MKVCIKRFFAFALFLSAAILQAFEQQTIYTVITRYGNISEVSHNLGENESVVPSKNGTKAYRVKTIQVKSEEHLLELMGSENESALTDLQRGLLETLRFSRSQDFEELYPRVPDSTEKITLNLVDITGYEDQARFPDVRRDFWPVNKSVYRYTGKKYLINGEIRISGVDVLGFGPMAAERMKYTYAHEFGHSLDITRAEEDAAYGYDHTHYINEKIKPKAAFAEGFANFVRWLFFEESTEKEFRNSLKNIKIEKPLGGYDEYPVLTDKLAGEDYLNIEAINALIFAMLASELPNGRMLVLDSFQKHNNAENRMTNFLQNFLKDHPEYSLNVAQILDRETFGRLSNSEIKLILGSNKDIEAFLSQRLSGIPQLIASSTQNMEAKPETSAGIIYKWQDAMGNWQFTDQPPPENTDFTAISRSPEPMHGREISIENNGNPFSIDY